MKVVYDQRRTVFPAREDGGDPSPVPEFDERVAACHTPQSIAASRQTEGASLLRCGTRRNAAAGGRNGITGRLGTAGSQLCHGDDDRLCAPDHRREEAGMKWDEFPGSHDSKEEKE